MPLPAISMFAIKDSKRIDLERIMTMNQEVLDHTEKGLSFCSRNEFWIFYLMFHFYSLVYILSIPIS